MNGTSTWFWPDAVDDPRTCPSHGLPMKERIFVAYGDSADPKPDHVRPQLMCALCLLHLTMGSKFFLDRHVQQLRQSSRRRKNPMGL